MKLEDALKPDAVRKINSFGMAGYIVCMIGRVLTIIAAIVCLLSGIILCFVPKNAIKLELISTNSVVVKFDSSYNMDSLVDFDDVDGIEKIGRNTYKIFVDENGKPMETSMQFRISDLKWMLFVAVIACAAACAVLIFVGRFFNLLKKCNTPFTYQAAKALTDIAWSLVPMVFINSIMQSVSNSTFSGMIEISFTVDLMAVLLVVCVYMLSFVFKHGADMQEEIYRARAENAEREANAANAELQDEQKPVL